MSEAETDWVLPGDAFYVTPAGTALGIDRLAFRCPVRLSCPPRKCGCRPPHAGPCRALGRTFHSINPDPASHTVGGPNTGERIWEARGIESAQETAQVWACSMMLSSMTGYAATALAWLAGHDDGHVQVKDIAEGAGVPSAYLSKIIHQLGRRGVLETRRGIGGGVLLKQGAEMLTLYDLAEALDDPILKPKCMLGAEECSDSRACAAHRFWKAHWEEGIAFLKETTIQEIQQFEAGRADSTMPTVEGDPIRLRKEKES